MRREEELKSLSCSIDNQKEILSSLKNTIAEIQQQADSIYERKLKEIDQQLANQYVQCEKEYNKRINELKVRVSEEENKLHDLEQKQLAYIEAQKRKEAIAANKDYYRLAIDEMSLNEIARLRDLQKSFSKKEIIDKVIYEGYYKPAYDILMSHLFKNNNKISGIYMITNQITGAIYIGQSVDTRERMRQHIKASISSSLATNKLYKAMKEDGIHNFTFEILEEVPREKLNEREMYWIEFYHAKEQLNSTKGGA